MKFEACKLFMCYKLQMSDTRSLSSFVKLLSLCIQKFSPLLLLLRHQVLMELLAKPEILTSYIYGPTFGNAESRLFLFAVQCFNTESMLKLSCVTVVCKHFASYEGYPNYRWDLTHTLLMSYIYGAPCKARDFNVVYIWTYVWQR
jgi:hypothetical protein